ncbi:RDD family protein [Agromyces archimandritae]|uniref:RDD family protein n=1 Tax=Agromyces archimandritae TaxID=2781962 RepID=A0A975FMK9_9MICO|nr:RDD family protein [Agromyces archimandritae]QTX05238.1 RDD family protein [Agromyces archimandritae]
MPTPERVLDEPDDRLLTGEAVALDVRSAGFVIRAGGAVIDMIAIFAGLLLTFWLFASIAGTGLDQAAGQAIATVLAVFWLVVVPAAVEAATGGRSPGKFALGVRVVRDDGGGITVRHALIRALTGVFEVYLTFGGLAVLVGLLNPRAKRIGDFLAGTHAQLERVPKPVSEPQQVPPPLAAWARTADVARLPDPVARRITAFFEHGPHLTPDARARNADALVREVAPYVAPLPDAPAEPLLSAVVAVRREREARALELAEQRRRRIAPVLAANPHGFPGR